MGKRIKWIPFEVVAKRLEKLGIPKDDLTAKMLPYYRNKARHLI